MIAITNKTVNVAKVFDATEVSPPNNNCWQIVSSTDVSPTNGTYW